MFRITGGADATIEDVTIRDGRAAGQEPVGTARCAGSLTLRLGARKLRKAYSIAAGQKALVTLKLGAGDRRRLARRRSIRSAVTVVTTQPDGSRRTTHQGSVKLLRA